MHKRLHPPKFNSSRLELIWAALGTCGADEALEFVLELERMLGRGTFPTTRSKDKQADAIACLREAAELLAGSPSIRQYETLRKERPELDLVPAGTIRTRLAGSWNECLRRAQLEEAPDDGYASSTNPTFTDEELLDVIRECARELGEPPVVVTYRAWAKRSDVIVRPGKRPRTESPFIRRFGNFRAAVLAAGFDFVPNARRNRPTANTFAYSDAECFAALRLVHDRFGFSPSVQEYAQIRSEIRARAQAGEDLEPLPSPSLLMRRFRTWALALEAAGLPPRRVKDFEGTRSKPGPKEPFYSDTEIKRWVRTAYAVVGEPFTEQAYKKWRTSELLKEGLGPQSIPSSWTVSARFRGWFTACETILRAEEADEDEVNNDSGSDESGGKGGSGVGGGDGSAGDSCAGAPAHA